jgi:hypothetical protein
MDGLLSTLRARLLPRADDDVEKVLQRWSDLDVSKPEVIVQPWSEKDTILGTSLTHKCITGEIGRASLRPKNWYRFHVVGVEPAKNQVGSSICASRFASSGHAFLGLLCRH